MNPTALTDLRAARTCGVCHAVDTPAEARPVRSNVRRYRERQFAVWRCRRCDSLNCERVDDLAAYYADYPIRQQGLNYFTRAWYANVLRRLVDAGLKPEHTILDFGCNQGLLVRYLREHGYARCDGFDPYVAEWNRPEALRTQYDVVVTLDVVEHDLDPAGFVGRMAALARPGGLVCIETPNADGIDLADTEKYLHSLHVPYHVHVLSERALGDLAAASGLSRVAFYDRWYMDAWPPATARRLFENLMTYAGNDIDSGYEPPRLGLFLRHPSLLWHLFFGYWMPEGRRDHMMAVFRRG